MVYVWLVVVLVLLGVWWFVCSLIKVRMWRWMRWFVWYWCGFRLVFFVLLLIVFIVGMLVFGWSVLFFVGMVFSVGMIFVLDFRFRCLCWLIFVSICLS